MPQRPWFKFYPGDWRADPALRMCSLAARGLWIDLLAIMHEADPYGHLVVGGAVPDDRTLAKLAGISQQTLRKLLKELEVCGVFSRTNEGIIYSRRMVRDYEKNKQDQANGRKGGNPQIIKGVNPPVNGEDKAQKLEARNQKLEQQPDGYAVWELWQDRRKHHGHGTDAAPPSPKVLRMGSEWIAAGADLTLIRKAFDSVLSRKGDPPRSLAYCDGAVRDAVKAKPKPAPTFEAMHATRVKTYEKTGFWDSSWGPQPEAA